MSLENITYFLFLLVNVKWVIDCRVRRDSTETIIYLESFSLYLDRYAGHSKDLKYTRPE